MAAVGTVTRTESVIKRNLTQFWRKYVLAWTSDASGNVSGAPFGVPPGFITAVKAVPGAASVQPTDGYVLILKDTDALDYLSGAGSAMSNATPMLYAGGLAQLFQDGTQVLELTISGAGNAKSGTVTVWIETQQ